MTLPSASPVCWVCGITRSSTRDGQLKFIAGGKESTIIIEDARDPVVALVGTVHADVAILDGGVLPRCITASSERSVDIGNAWRVQCPRARLVGTIGSTQKVISNGGASTPSSDLMRAPISIGSAARGCFRFGKGSKMK